ncbi:hypothetical protein L917_18666, partial [Phytophthora nicotianae]
MIPTKQIWTNSGSLSTSTFTKYLGAYGNGNTSIEIGKCLGVAPGSVAKYLKRSVAE